MEGYHHWVARVCPFAPAGLGVETAQPDIRMPIRAFEVVLFIRIMVLSPRLRVTSVAFPVCHSNRFIEKLEGSLRQR